MSIRLALQAAAAHADKEAVVGLARTLSYAELDAESTLLARRLQQLGLGTIATSRVSPSSMPPTRAV